MFPPCSCSCEPAGAMLTLGTRAKWRKSGLNGRQRHVGRLQAARRAAAASREAHRRSTAPRCQRSLVSPRWQLSWPPLLCPPDWQCGVAVVLISKRSSKRPAPPFRLPRWHRKLEGRSVCRAWPACRSPSPFPLPFPPCFPPCSCGRQGRRAGAQALPGKPVPDPCSGVPRRGAALHTRLPAGVQAGHGVRRAPRSGQRDGGGAGGGAERGWGGHGWAARRQRGGGSSGRSARPACARCCSGRG